MFLGVYLIFLVLPWMLIIFYRISWIFPRNVPENWSTNRLFSYEGVLVWYCSIQYTVYYYYYTSTPSTPVNKRPPTPRFLTRLSTRIFGQGFDRGKKLQILCIVLPGLKGKTLNRKTSNNLSNLYPLPFLHGRMFFTPLWDRTYDF